MASSRQNTVEGQSFSTCVFKHSEKHDNLFSINRHAGWIIV